MIEDAVKALRQGKVICLYDYDNRERETDLVFAAEFSTPKLVYQLRRDAGGLMCVAIDPVACDTLGIPYITDVLKYAGKLRQRLRGDRVDLREGRRHPL